MDDRDLEVARLTFLKDGLIAEHESGQTWWQVVLGAGLGATALGLYNVTGPSPLAGAIVAAGGIALVLLAALLRRAYRRLFRRELFGLAIAIGRLKEGE